MNKFNDIKQSEEFNNFSNEFEKNVSFLESFSSLITYSGKMITFISDKKVNFFNTILLQSCCKTLKNIENCCSNGSFSDANTLIRKLRDDLLLHVYILDNSTKRNVFKSEELDKLDLSDVEKFNDSFSSMKIDTALSGDEIAVAAWLENSVDQLSSRNKRKLSFDNYMNYFQKDDRIKQILKDYKLENYWLNLTVKLNDYVHNNGIKFTSHNLVNLPNTNLEVFLNNINIRVSYILTFFLLLILMIDSTLVRSDDIMDYLENDMVPPENIQYEIAPFIQEYIDEKVIPLNPELKQYLKDYNINGMNIR